MSITIGHCRCRKRRAERSQKAQLLETDDVPTCSHDRNKAAGCDSGRGSGAITTKPKWSAHLAIVIKKRTIKCKPNFYELITF
jgi:hypothetical protein